MYSAADIAFDEMGCCTYTLLIEGTPSGQIHLSVPGVHNVYNSLAAIAAAKKLGLSLEVIATGLSGFHGTERRFEKKGEFNGVTVIDDYAHHPDEIKATLASAAHYPHKTVWCVFQPHTYSRTKFCSRNLQKRFPTQIRLFLPIFMLQEKRIHWASALLI